MAPRGYAKRKRLLAKSDTSDKPMTEDEIRARRQKLLDELAELPNPEANNPGLRPGTEVGTGPAREKVAFTESWYLDVEARRKDLDENGRPMWPDYQLHPVILQEKVPFKVIRVNGVGFTLYPGVECKLPSPHYAVYRENTIEGPKRKAAAWAPPQNPGRQPGYISPVHLMGVGAIKGDEKS